MAEDPTTPNPETPDPQTSDAEAPDYKAELDKVTAALKAANRESAERRKRLEALEKAEAERKTAEMTELDKAKADAQAARDMAAKAEQRARETLIRAAFVAEAAKAGAAHPEDVYLLADRSAVEVTDDGVVAGVAEAVKALVDAGRVPLAGRAPAPNLDGGAGGGDRSRGTAKLTPLEIDLAKKLGLSAEQYAKNKAEISARTQE